MSKESYIYTHTYTINSVDSKSFEYYINNSSNALSLSNLMPLAFGKKKVSAKTYKPKNKTRKFYF